MRVDQEGRRSKQITEGDSCGEAKSMRLGAFVADLICRTARLPAWGETILWIAFKLGPGGGR
jgi:hypothetical protein